MQRKVGEEKETEPEPYDATIHRRMEHATVMIINTVIVVLCIYLIVTSPLQHFRFGCFFLRRVEVEDEVQLSILRGSFVYVVCFSVQMVPIELLKWHLRSSQSIVNEDAG